jgi:hypothetical protein
MLAIPSEPFVIRDVNLKVVSTGLECPFHIVSYPIPVEIMDEVFGRT